LLIVGQKLNEMHDPEKRKKANPLRQKARDTKKEGEAVVATPAPAAESDNLVHA